MRKGSGQRKTRPKESSLRRVHKQAHVPAVPLKLRPCPGTPLQAPASPMHSRGSHGKRLLIPPRGERSDLQLGRDGNLRYSAAGLAPAPGSLRTEDLVRLRHRFSIHLWKVYTLLPDLSRGTAHFSQDCFRWISCELCLYLFRFFCYTRIVIVAAAPAWGMPCAERGGLP